MKRTIPMISCVLGLFLLIFDAKTAIDGGKEGLNLCLQTIIPALLPFFVISGYLCQNLSHISVPFLRPLGKLCGIPDGAETLMLLGFLGGYPIGAKNVCDCAKSGALDMNTARRMIGFCSNAGPAFIFGMAGALFSKSSVPLILWLVHILGAIIVGIFLPGRDSSSILSINPSTKSFIEIVENSIRSMAHVCCWVILFRIVISFCKRWFLWMFPIEFQVFLIGITELSNGVVDLSCVANEGLRFIICSVILSFGGTCVAMQTRAVTGEIGTGYYFPGKLLQGCISFVLSTQLQSIIFTNSETYKMPVTLTAAVAGGCILCFLFLCRRKNNSRKLTPNLI